MESLLGKRGRRVLFVVAGLAAAAIGSVAYQRLYDGRPELTGAADSAGRHQVVVGPNVHVSAAMPAVHHDACTIAADPANPRRLFAASMHWHAPDETGVVGYRSHDGGATWQLGLERIGREPRQRLGDEAVAFAPDGDLYLAHMRGMPETTETGRSTEVVYSGDGGQTWQERGRLDRFADRPQIAVDTTSGRFRGRLYCNANDNHPLFFASSDGARTLDPARLPDPGLVTVAPSNPVVLPDGTVVIAFRKGGVNAAEPPTIPVWRSSDGGKTFTAATPVPTAWRHARARSNNGLGVVYPLLAAGGGDAGHGAGRLYCVWVDGERSDQRYVLLSFSDDRGATWTPPAVLSEQPLGPDPAADYQAEIASVAVNRRGVVAVSWYDRRGLPKAARAADGSIRSVGYNVRLRASPDGGATWLSSVRVNEAPGKGDLADLRYWSGLAADAEGRFHPLWISDHTGVRQLWSAVVEVDPPSR